MRIGNFKLERGFRGGRLSAWNLKIMRVLILRCLGEGELFGSVGNGD